MRMTRHALLQPLARDSTVPDEPPRFLSRDSCAALIQQVLGYASGRGTTSISVWSNWRGDVRWGRNRISIAQDWRTSTVAVGRHVGDTRSGYAQTNQLDAASLAAAVQWAEQMLHVDGVTQHAERSQYPPVPQPYPATHIWSDRTYTQSADDRSDIATTLVRGAEAAGMLSAGYLSVIARGTSYRTKEGLLLYTPQTLAQCSLTVRDPQGTGSGWAGASSYDWNRFDAQQLAAIALDKCLKSRNPVAIEPGRYTTILEPQATFDFVRAILNPPFLYPAADRESEERDRKMNPQLPFSNPPGHTPVPGLAQEVVYSRTKIGQQLLDPRISLTYQPEDLDLGVVPFRYNGEAMVPVTWFDKGVLTTLAYDRHYAQEQLHLPWGAPNSCAFRMDVRSPLATTDEMIAMTTRGLLVTRMWGVNLLDSRSMLLSGMTRDGVWLIEHGKISKPVRNMRWTESPLLALNRLEQAGTSVPIFCPETPAVVPPVQLRDFSFTALVDAI